ncbi:MAG: ABC transporter permease [Anaerovoracaceae bacterium]
MIRAVVKRILRQMKNDRRTLALIFGAPVFLLTLIYFILADSTVNISVAAVNCPIDYIESLEEEEVRVMRMTEAEAYNALERGEINAALTLENNKMEVLIDGSNSSDTSQTLNLIKSAKLNLNPASADTIDVEYIYGYEGLGMFDNFGSVLIGFIVFFFVFLIAGISFLQERTSGTLEKLLSTPIKRWQIVVGYVAGFGILVTVQSVIIASYCVYVLRIMMIGNFFLVLLVVLLAAVTALTLGILISTMAKNEFQMIQFIPIIIVPQVFFSGLFDISEGLMVIGRFMPLYYVADALGKIMIKGMGIEDIFCDIAVLVGFSAVFMILNTKVLKKYRRL